MPPIEPGTRQRQLLFAARPVAYTLVRARRRSIGMLVGPDGLEVRAPRWVSVREIEQALFEKADWILRQLAQAEALQQRRQAQAIEWRDGSHFPYLGRPMRICLGTAPMVTDAPTLLAPPPTTMPAAEPSLCLGLPPQAPEAQVRTAVQHWLKRQAGPYFTARLDHFAELVEVRWRELGLSGAQSRWGSASADGRIRLSWRLMHLPPTLIDYVVVHELSHLRVMNHSPAFWQVVGQVMPDYRQRRAELREQAINADL